MEEILQLLTWLNTREHTGASVSEVKKRTALIRRLAPGFTVIYWSEIDSWVLVPLSALPEMFHP
jgi:hypothetical protein